MGTFKLHISCTQAMCSLQNKLHTEHFQYTQRGAACDPFFAYMFANASHNALHAADHAAGHAAGHAVQNHVLKNLYPDLGMPKPCS